ncbi:MAG: HAD family acid phosphatase [Nocardioides sp.]
MHPRITLLSLGAVVLTFVMTAAAQPASARPLPSERQWHRDVSAAMAGSRDYLRAAVAEPGPTYAINLDIDNTSLATHYDPGARIGPVFRLTRWAANHGVAVLFNTARYGANIKAGKRLLRAAGYTVTEICGRSGPKVSLARGKVRCRQHFVDEGYTIVANVGNNRTDFSGTKNYGRAFRLPNYGGRLG